MATDSSAAPASRTRVLVVVLAGGAGSRLGALTERRAKPAIPFAGMYRLIDVTLSNIAHSGLDDVWVIEQYEPHSLNDHLANGRPWDLDRTHGGLQILPPFQRTDGDDAMASGNADALVQHRASIATFHPDVVVTMSADHLYQLDLRDVLDTHARQGVVATAVTNDPPDGDDATRYAWVTVGDDGRIEQFEYKPDTPRGDRICTEIFAFDGPVLLERLADLAGRDSAGDYGDALLPDLVAEGGVFEHQLAGYWRDVGTIDAYHRVHMELVDDDPPLRLDDPAWPMLTGSIVGAPARVTASATVSRSLLSPGVSVAGTVEGSVLGRNVTVERGAVVRDSVVLDDAVIRSGAVVEQAIVDSAMEVTAETPGARDEDSDILVYSGDG